MAGAAPQTPQTSIARPGDAAYDPRNTFNSLLPGNSQLKNGFGDTFVTTPLQPNSVANTPDAGLSAFIKSMGETGVAQITSPGQSIPGVQQIAENFPINLPPNMQGQSFSYGPDAQGGNSQLMQAPMQPGQPDPVNGVMPMAPIALPKPGVTSGKGGGASTAMPTPPVAGTPQPRQAPQYTPMAPQQQGGFNVNQASAGALQGAIGATQQAMQGPINIGAYANPFTGAVIERTQQDIERQRQMAQNQLGAQATAARAFGGSRQGVAEGVMAGEYGRMAGDIAAQQRQANYSQALQAAMADRQARLGAASQLGGLGQQAFQTGQTIQQQQAQQGLLQQGIQQALIDAARQQYAGYTGAPSQALQAPLAALGVTPTPQTTTNSMQPGLFNYLQLGANVMGAK